MSKYIKRDYFKMDPIEVWNLVRSGKLKVFPNNYLDKEICKILVRQLIINEEKMSREEILNIDQNFFSKHNLGGVRKFFESKIYKVLMYSFPELDIKPWELKKASPGIWKDINIRNDFVKAIAKEENIDLNKIEDIQKFSAVMIQNHGGSKALTYAGGLFKLIEPVIPSDIHEWQVFKVSKWDKEKAVTAVKWLIESKLKWNHEEVYNNISASIFYKYDLGGMLSKFCNNSPLQALNLAYPNEYTSLKNQRPLQFSN